MNGLPEILRREINVCGAIPFARFMELSLYCPHFGYYEQLTNTPGRGGDFYTSVSVGPLFGELLAAQFAQWLGHWDARSGYQINEPVSDRLQLLEAGAHDGRLAADILDWFNSRRPQLFHKLEYWILEPSPRRRQWQEKTLARFNGRVRWFDSWGALPPTGVHGVIFSNELLDAMPVHRLGWDAQNKTWFEWGVGTEGSQFVWQKLPPNPSLSQEELSRSAAVLGSSNASTPKTQQPTRTTARTGITTLTRQNLMAMCGPTPAQRHQVLAALNPAAPEDGATPLNGCQGLASEASAQAALPEQLAPRSAFRTVDEPALPAELQAV